MPANSYPDGVVLAVGGQGACKLRHHPVIDGSNAKKSPTRCVKRDAEAAVTNAKKTNPLL
ncbi:hypothetical protein DS520_16810 [Salmonella enterica subsp. enterica serovar Zanzibar]|nr:hypothetical protein [Salmonella enterica]EBR9834485.1 hypothetical protein [Salmonella enterica subsp. enterica serovar Zanzibar]